MNTECKIARYKQSKSQTYYCCARYSLQEYVHPIMISNLILPPLLCPRLPQRHLFDPATYLGLPAIQTWGD